MAKKSKRSSGAVAQVWKIFSKHKERAEALAAAEKAGINPNTAKTQWQRFSHATPKERAAKIEGDKKEKKNGAKQEAVAQS
jgi:methylphosphotriester-DNA--protein-cysteine methyltransferase